MLNTGASLKDVRRANHWECSGWRQTTSCSVTTVSARQAPPSACLDLSFSSEFGVYIDKGGILVNGPFTIEWEGVAERAAYRDPYVLLFSSGFVEVRDAVSGRLEQIIRGDSIRCIWEGNRSMGKNHNDGDGQPNQNLSFIGVMNTPAGLDELAVQCIFTLVPSEPSHSPTQTQTSIPERSNL